MWNARLAGNAFINLPELLLPSGDREDEEEALEPGVISTPETGVELKGEGKESRWPSR